jgi:hypothetical protein
MADDSPDTLPTFKEWVESYLGFQLPSVPLPHTLKNADKAVAKVVLALGENVEARIRGGTKLVGAKSKITVDQLFRTADEKRKFENRAAATRVALDEIKQAPGTVDATADIEDDWLNFYAKLAEDKSSAELQQLFGRILAGEIRKPGSFSLRTLQLVSTLSKEDAEAIAKFLPYAIEDQGIAIRKDLSSQPTVDTRLRMEDIGVIAGGVVAGSLSQFGGLLGMDFSVEPNSKRGWVASKRAIAIENKSPVLLALSIQVQALTQAARELIPIAKLDATELEYLKEVAEALGTQCKDRYSAEYNSGFIQIRVGDIEAVSGKTVALARVLHAVGRDVAPSEAREGR